MSRIFWRETKHGPIQDFNLDRITRETVQATMEYTEGSVKWAASEMGINPRTLYRWLDRWDKKGEIR